MAPDRGTAGKSRQSLWGLITQEGSGNDPEIQAPVLAAAWRTAEEVIQASITPQAGRGYN